MSRVPRRVGLVGPMLGGHAGWVANPGQTLAALLDADGWPTLLTSTRRRPLARLRDTYTTLRRWRGQVDAVVALVYSGPGFAFADLAGRLTRRRLKVPLVLWLHGGNLPDFAVRHPRWTRAVLGRADRLVAPSGFLAEAFRDLGPPVHVIPNPLSLIDYPYRLRERATPKLLWMRTFHPIYQPLMAVEVLHRLRQTHPDATLTMAGQDRGQQAATQARAQALGLGDAVSFAGFLDPAAKQEAFARHDIFLNTNRIDNAPVSVVEAGAFGLPVVTTNVGGLRHLVRDGESALLVDPDDTPGMARAVARLLDDDALTAGLSRAGRALAASCDGPRVCRSWQALLRDLEGHHVVV